MALVADKVKEVKQIMKEKTLVLTGSYLKSKTKPVCFVCMIMIQEGAASNYRLIAS